MSLRDIAFASGLSRAEIGKLQFKTEWNRVEVETMHRFALACGVNLLSTSEHRDYTRRRKLVYLRTLTPSQRRLHDKLVDLLLRSRKNPSA